MSSDRMTGSTAHMQTAANLVDEAYHTVNGIRVQIANHKADIASGWNSMASQTWLSAFDLFEANLAKIHQNIHDIGAGLHLTGINYSTNDTDVQALAGRLGSLLNQ